MKISTLLLITAALTGQALAEVPKKRPVTAYAGLWTNSPFTSKPPPGAGPVEVNPLEDYALGGVSPIPGGYRVTLLNRKKPDERIVLPDNSSEFKILSVQQNPADPMGITVRLSAGTKQGSVAFDRTLLALKAAPIAQPQQPNPGLPNQPQPNGAVPGIPGMTPPAGGNPGANPGGNNGGAPLRPRVVPNNPNAAGGNPAVTQQPQRPQIQRPGNTPQRPNRR